MSLSNPSEAYPPPQPQVVYGHQRHPYVAQPGYMPYIPNGIVQQPRIVPQKPSPHAQQQLDLAKLEPLLNTKTCSNEGPIFQVDEVSGQKAKSAAPKAPTETKTSGSSETRGEKRKLQEVKDSEKIVNAGNVGKKTEIAYSIQSFINKLKIKKPKKADGDGENQVPFARTAGDWQELFQKRQKLKNSVITKLPFQSVKRRTVVVSNIAAFPSVLEVFKFIKDNLEAVGLHEGDQIEQIIVPKVDYYGTPKHTGYVQIVVKDVKYISTVIDAFTKKIFCERAVNVRQT